MSAALFLSVFAAILAQAQALPPDLARLVQIPAVTGHEGALAREIESRIAPHKAQRDNLGNLYVTIGAGAPHRLIVTPMDEPGYVVSAITADGYLRVQRLPQQAPHGLFEQLHAAQAVVITTRKGTQVYGVVAGLSTHLQGGRRDAPQVSHLDEIFIDIGASNEAEARRAGVDVLDSIAVDRALLPMSGMAASMAVGDRFGAAALVELLRRLDKSKVKGTLTVAFVAQQWATSRGLDRLMQHVKPDEVVYVGRLLARRGGGGPQARQEQTRKPAKQPGSGVLVGVGDASAAPAGLAAEIWKLAEENKIPVAADFTAPLPRVSYTQGPVMPERFAHLAVATAWASTPAEFVSQSDAYWLGEILEAYAHGTYQAKPAPGEASTRAHGAPPARPQAAPKTEEILQSLVETYGISGYEGGVLKEIERLLPAWAKTETDEAGNLILRLGGANAKGPKLLFVAHMDEIGYVVRSIADDGRLVVQSRGGGIIEFFAGHPMLVQTARGERYGVMELPAGWDEPNFEWPRGQQAQLRVDVGARSAAEVAQLGIQVGDWMTVPKKYRKLYGTRANGRSFDDRVGCTALVAAVWALGPTFAGRDVTFAWVTEEEVGLRGAKVVADRLAGQGRTPDYVFAVDTFVSSDSPLESKRFANAEIGKGFVMRAVDNSNISPLAAVDRVIQLARANNIAVQYGVTGGGNDGAVFLRHGAVDIPISWALRYSHSPGEVIDTRDVDALARIVAVLSRGF